MTTPVLVSSVLFLLQDPTPMTPSPRHPFGLSSAGLPSHTCPSWTTLTAPGSPGQLHCDIPFSPHANREGRTLLFHFTEWHTCLYRSSRVEWECELPGGRGFPNNSINNNSNRSTACGIPRSPPGGPRIPVHPHNHLVIETLTYTHFTHKKTKAQED